MDRSNDKNNICRLISQQTIQYTVQLYLTLAVVSDVMTTAKVSFNGQTIIATMRCGNEQSVRAEYMISFVG
jgi:hypothetical protein